MARAGSCGGDAAARERAGVAEPQGPAELSLEEVLKAYEQPLNEEQAWAVCFQGCRGLRGAQGPRRIRHTADIVLRRDGSVGARREPEPATMEVPPASSEAQVVQSLGFAIYRALDWGLDESEERELSPQLERLMDLMANSDDCDDGGGGADEGYGGPEEEEAAEGSPRAVRTFAQAMQLCAARLSDPRSAQSHYQAVCRALFLETLELRAFLARVREAKEMLQKLREDEPQVEKPLADLDHLGHTDWARLWVQLMRELRHGVKLKKVQEQEFNPLPTEFQLTPFEMLMQDIRARNYKLRKVDGDIPPRVKKDAHEIILDFIRSRPPLKQVSERRLRPLPQKQRTLHEKILEEIKQERKLRPVGSSCWGTRGFGSLPCILNACSGDVSSTSCINLSPTGAGSSAQRPRPRVLLKAPTLAEMEEMNTSEEEESPCGQATLKRDRSFSEHDLAWLHSEAAPGLQPPAEPPGGQELLLRPRAGTVHSQSPGQEPGSAPGSVEAQPDPRSPRHSSPGPAEERPEATALDSQTRHLWLEFSHPVESLALTVEEVVDVRRVLVKAEMEKFLQNKELYSSLRKGKICCCCRAKFPLFSWPSTCLFCKRWDVEAGTQLFPRVPLHGADAASPSFPSRAVCNSCSVKIKMPSKKFAHIPVYSLGFESPPRTSADRTTPAQRRDIFQWCWGGSRALQMDGRWHSQDRPLQGPRWRSVEDEFPHIYSHGCVLRDLCSGCSSFVADVVRSSRRSVDVLNSAARRARHTQSLYVPSPRTLDFE
ncbi:protein spire homolog 2 isoform X1 [Choloepus didactylus]|uniref:protein spire homolog 2 isoform X1 n=1 Tax=Choloepus didactylus TaxID=27675 RepID=UPI00189EAB51|nr:protein spire homolog 2 isoform X1 [Choloepus didactylus]